MKKLFVLIAFWLGPLHCAWAQDMTIDKGSGWLYFTGEPGTTPDPACCAEVAINRTTREAWIWNVGLAEWERWYAFTQGIADPSGSPGTGPVSYLNRLTGKWFRWTGSAWLEVGGTLIEDASDIDVIVQNGVTGPTVQDELEDLRADLIAGGDGWGADTVARSTNQGLLGNGTAASPMKLDTAYVKVIAGYRVITLSGSGETVLRLRYFGNGTPTMVKTGAGNFTVTMPAGTVPASLNWTGNNTNLDGSNAINLLLVTTSMASEYFTSQIRSTATGNIANTALLGIVTDIDVPSAGNLDCTWTSMNGFGASGFTIIANF